ncbi:MAG: hypothetical protein WD826_02805 [Actinomycetota bacterium]
MVIIGGLGSLVGSALGAFLVFGVRPLLSEALGDPTWVNYLVFFATGLALILVITRARGGLAGLFFLPRDPVVEGLVWHDRETRAGDEGEPADEQEVTAALERVRS